jgi:hypothetical protein
MRAFSIFFPGIRGGDKRIRVQCQIDRLSQGKGLLRQKRSSSEHQRY